MGLFSKRNIDKAKKLAEKNAAKIAQGVDKATDVVNKKTGGKYADKLEKVDQAAQKFAGQDDTPTTAATDPTTDPATRPATDPATGPAAAPAPASTTDTDPVTEGDATTPPA